MNKLQNAEKIDDVGTYAHGYMDRSANPTKGISMAQKDKIKVLKNKIKK